MKKIFIFIITVVLCMLQACKYDSFNSKNSDKQNGKDTDTVHIAILPVNESEPLRYAQQNGIFDSLGISVSLDTFMAAMDADTAFINGKAQFIITDSIKAKYLTSLCLSLGDSDSVYSIITDTLELSLMTANTARIRNLKSLKEKIIAVTRNSAIDYSADKILQSAQLKKEELNRPQINNIELRAQMLNLSQYDGAILPEPFATQCEEMGAYRLHTIKEPILVLLTRNKYIKNNKEISLIKKAYERGKQLYLADKRKQIAAKRKAEAQSDNNNGTRKNTNKNNIR